MGRYSSHELPALGHYWGEFCECEAYVPLVITERLDCLAIVLFRPLSEGLYLNILLVISMSFINIYFGLGRV